MDSVNWARCADAAYHRELAGALCGAAEADALALLVGAMLRVCSPRTPRTFRRGVLRVLLNAQRSATTGHVTLTQHTPLDVLSSHSAYCYRVHAAAPPPPDAPPPVSHPPTPGCCRGRLLA